MFLSSRSIVASRSARRGTLLVVVLGLLVALFIIGTSFSFVTLAERQAATNYIDRQRALDLALDGVEYAASRLRADAAVQHHEGISPAHAGVVDGDYDPRQFVRAIDGERPSVTWARDADSTSTSSGPDGNWIDFDHDGVKGGNETSFGTTKIPGNISHRSGGFASTVTGFHVDGISMNQVRRPNVERAGDGAYGPSGTYEELGDYFRIRAIDAASMLPLNNFRGDRLEQVLLVLGEAIDAWLNNRRPTGNDNPFPPEIVLDIRTYAEEAAWVINSRDELFPIFRNHPDGERLYELASYFITCRSWRDVNYRDYAESNIEVLEGEGNPAGMTEQERMRSGWTSGGDGMDGWPDWQPDPSSSQKSPININTAPWPVLVAYFAGIEAKSRLLYFQRQSLITQSDQLMQDVFAQSVQQQNTGTTDIGRQNSENVGNTGVQHEQLWRPGNSPSQAIFQMVPVGPIETALGKSGQTTAQSGGAENAGALADRLIQLRQESEFKSWQDLDARFFRRELLSIENQGRTNITVPDVVGVRRSGLQGMDGGAVNSAYPRQNLLPLPDNCEHPANPIKSGDAAMKAGDFRAWYWKSVVDMLRAAMSPSNITNRYNADYPYHVNVDRMDLTVANGPICFSSMGRYEIISMGELLAPERARDAQATSTETLERLPVARRKIRCVIQIYDVWRHSSQRDFMSPLDPAGIVQALSQTQTTPPTQPYTRLTKSNTKSGPFSIDELSAGIWKENSGTEASALASAEDAKEIGYIRDGRNGPLQDQRDRFKGHNEWTAASGDFGYVTMNPLDRTPFTDLQGGIYPLNFHSRFNESLRARTKRINDTDPNYKLDGVVSDNTALDQNWGHIPLERGAMFDDFISSATPREHTAPLESGGVANEFASSSTGEEATQYATLMPDGAFLSAMKLRYRARRALGVTHGQRGLSRQARLKILRYPCGTHYAARPFMPIQRSDSSFPRGVKDSELPPEAWVANVSESHARARLEGRPGLRPTGYWRGVDDHNLNRQADRQRFSNMPYYEGTVDFWIKWDFPAQGSENKNFVAAMGEIDPASHNYSGLFGATVFGRFQDTQLGPDGDSQDYNLSKFVAPESEQRDSEADFEGVQFFVYKEPGGLIRFTRLYFSEALGAAVQNTEGGSIIQGHTVKRFGEMRRRIVDPDHPFSPYTGTNDICNDADLPSRENKGFLYSRTDAWVDLNEATFVSGGQRLSLRPHDWHRLTLSYNSNTETPYRFYIDGKRVSGVVFERDPTGEKGIRNDGRHKRVDNGMFDQPVPTEEASRPYYDIYRTSTRIMEINPEDRLTVGCIFRRQPDIADTNVYQMFYDTAATLETNKPPRPVFRFDSNFVAVANATIDDFRISARVITTDNVSPGDAMANSRYVPRNDAEAGRTYYEHGFFPMSRGDDSLLLGQPVRLGTISWSELRPDWDPYAARGLDLHSSSRIAMEWGVFENYQNMQPDGAENDLRTLRYAGRSQDMTGNASLESDDYWARGGMSLQGAVLSSGETVGVFVYRAHFQVGDSLQVNNVTPFLLDVTVTALTAPRKLWFTIEY